MFEKFSNIIEGKFAGPLEKAFSNQSIYVLFVMGSLLLYQLLL